MKSLYLNDHLHQQLKLLAAVMGKTLTQLVEDFLKRDVERELSDLSAKQLEKLAAVGGSFDFLNRPEEDIYSERDGKPLR